MGNKKQSSSKPGYLHGYSAQEQQRLYQQARFLEARIYQNIDFSAQNVILEVGCGVGAQTEILLERFPHLKICGVDASQAQIERAKAHLKDAVDQKKVTLTVGNAEKLPFEDNTFDGAFICWFLEHVQKPVEILREVRRVLKPGAKLFCNEVMNATFFLHPYSPATLQYWFAFNDHQWNLGGDPFVGAKLGNYLLAAGFQEIDTKIQTYHYDNRAPKRRAQMIEYWIKLLLSGTPGLLEAKKIEPKLVDKMRKELETLKNDEDAVFFYSWVQAEGRAF